MNNQTYAKIIKKDKKDSKLDDIVLTIILKNEFISTIIITAQNFYYECKFIKEQNNPPLMIIENNDKSLPKSYMKKIQHTIGFSLTALTDKKLDSALLNKLKFKKS